MRKVFSNIQLRINCQNKYKQHEKQILNTKNSLPVSTILLYSIVCFIFLSIGLWLAKDLVSSRASIITERSALAIQTSGLISQRFGNIITATDYVLRDVTTKVTADEINMASSDQEIQEQLSSMLWEKLSTLPGVFGLGFLNNHAVFVAAADESLIGIQSNSKLNVVNGEVLENQTYVEYVPASLSANKKPAILVSRPILSSEGNFLSGALAAIMINSTQDWINSFNISENDTIALVDEDGILLAVNPSKQDLIGTQLHFASDQQNIDLHDITSTSFTAASPIDMRERIFGLNKVDNIPLYIIVGYDMKTALHEWEQRLWQLSVGYLVIVILVAVLLRKYYDVQAQREKMRILSITDPLTGVFNRRQLMLCGDSELARDLRYKSNMSVLMLDIDNFKAINDTLGHATGDLAIQLLANSMVTNLRKPDIVGRLGGDEFVIIMPEIDADGAVALAKRLGEIIESSVKIKSDGDSQVCITVSIGVASMKASDSSFEEILARADKALYTAKANGRNSVVFA